jgi:predicted enzyme related to lactoylglutathione lyase
MPHGKICYVEMPAKDARASADFYSMIFGWNVRTRGDGALAFDDSTGNVSGSWIPERLSGGEEAMMTYIMVDSIADAQKKIVAARGKIRTPFTPIGNDGAGFAIFQDPTGNAMGLYQEASPSGRNA